MAGKSAEFLEERHAGSLFPAIERRRDTDPMYAIDRDPQATFTDRERDREK